MLLQPPEDEVPVDETDVVDSDEQTQSDSSEDEQTIEHFGYRR